MTNEAIAELVGVVIASAINYRVAHINRRTRNELRGATDQDNKMDSLDAEVARLRGEIQFIKGYLLSKLGMAYPVEQ